MRQLALVVLVASTALGQEAAQVAELAAFLEAADTQNLDAQISLETRERAVAEFTQAWTGLLPAISASAAWTHNQYSAEITTPNPATGQTVTITIVPADQFDGTIRIDLPLVDVTRWMRLIASGSARDGAAERAALTRDLVRKQVVAAYYGYAAALAVAESAGKSLAVAQAQLKLTETRAQVGTVTELEVMRARAELQRNQQLVADTASMVATSRRTLRTLSGVTPSDTVALPVPDLSPEPGFQELEGNVDALPAVKAADADVAAAGTLSAAAKLSLIPTVNAQFTERFTNATGFQGQSALYNYGVNLAWRLDGPIVSNMVIQERAAATARLVAERTRLSARDQIHSDWQRLNAGLQKVQAAEAQVAAARRAAEVARDRYAVGAATQVDVIQAERDVFSAEVGQIQARTELASARLSLRIDSGRPLTSAK